jgi:hypothetical protein
MLTLLTTAGILVAAPKFSKYIHGAASLFPETVPAYPHWFVADDTTGAMRAITVDELAESGMQPLATVRVTRHHSAVTACTVTHYRVWATVALVVLHSSM